MADRILTIREVADLLKINEKTVYKLAAESKIPGFKVGGSWRFDRGTITDWIARNSGLSTEQRKEHAARPPQKAREADKKLALVPRPVPHYTPQQGTFFAHAITLEGPGEDSFAQSLSTARVDRFRAS